MHHDAAVFKALLQHKRWKRCGHAVREVLWTNTNLRTLYGYLSDLHARTTTDLGIDEVRVYLESVRPPGDALVSLVEEYAGAPDINDEVLNESIREATTRGLAIKAAKGILETCMQPHFDPTVAHSILGDAVEAAATDANSSRILNLSDAGVPSFTVDRPNICSLGLGSKLDAAVGGGVAASELCIFLAGPKRGKTSLLSFIGTQAALRGQRVMHITLENPPQMCARRYDSALTGLDYHGLISNQHMLKPAHARIEEAGGSVHIVNWQYEERSPGEILPLVSEVGGIDVLIIDYLQLMLPDRSKMFSKREQRHLFSKLGKDMCRVGAELHIPTISAWQVNREGSQAETVNEHDISESWDILQHASAAIGISMNREEFLQGVVRLHTLRARYNATPASVKYNVNLDRNQFTEVK